MPFPVFVIIYSERNTPKIFLTIAKGGLNCIYKDGAPAGGSCTMSFCSEVLR